MLLPYLNKDLIEAGCDEAGRGCLAGSVYAAAVILPVDFKNELLNDSRTQRDDCNETSYYPVCCTADRSEEHTSELQSQR